uniref:Ig-like domain-containing protein n=1 Tax=Astyanax mexicanus TaxID=7994 RepID=A0A3B1IQW1_ASTMX
NPHTTVYTGDTLTLTCDLKISLTGWTFMWFRVSQQLQPLTPEYKNTNTLSITASDTAEYQCIAIRGENIHPDYSDPVKITVRKRPKATVKVQPAERVFIRERVTLTCDIESGEDWRYEWFKNNNPLSEAQWRKKYEISNVDGSDEGDYSCKGRGLTESSYSEISAAVRLTVSEKPKPTLRVDPLTTVYTGDTLTLTCDLKISHTGWTFRWFRVSQPLQPLTPEYKNTLSITASDTAEYQCSALRGENSYTDYSDPVKITVRSTPKSTVKVQPAERVFIRERVTLTCDIESEEDWSYEWFKNNNPLSEAQWRKKYEISNVDGSDEGDYSCKGRRLTEPSYSEISAAVRLTVSGESSSPPVSLMVRPSRTQHFIKASLSLSCEGQSDSTGWRVRRYTHSEKVSDCTSVWSTGPTCSISSLSTSHTGVYWCESKSGERSYPAIITAHNGKVILDSTVHPVSEGAPLTLRCLYRFPKPSNLSADFYKDGSFLQTQPAGEMIIPAASKIHEGFYHCKHPEKGESPTSWISVRGTEAPFSALSLLSCLVAASPYLLASIILGVKCYRARGENSINSL